MTQGAEVERRRAKPFRVKVSGWTPTCWCSHVRRANIQAVRHTIPVVCATNITQALAVNGGKVVSVCSLQLLVRTRVRAGSPVWAAMHRGHSAADDLQHVELFKDPGRCMGLWLMLSLLNTHTHTHSTILPDNVCQDPQLD